MVSKINEISLCPTFLKLRDKVLEFNKGASIVGILNITPDSFFDGGRYMDPAKALDRAFEMAEEGASMIDIGGESSRPGSREVPIEIETGRIIPVIKAIAQKIDIPISVDTTKSEVARAALDAGAHAVNDITALSGDTGMAGIVTNFKCGLILMHMKGIPITMQDDPMYTDVVFEIKNFLTDSIRYATDMGIEAERICVDPGIGFGKTVEHNLEILRRLREISELGFPVMIGASRKSFIGRTLNIAEGERLEGSVASAIVAVLNGASILRVHDVKETLRAVRMAEAIMKSKLPANTTRPGM